MKAYARPDSERPGAAAGGLFPTAVLICSPAHSGSTLLGRLLGSHSRIAALGEVVQLPKNIALNTVCGCGQPARACHLWTAVAERIRENEGIDLLSEPYHFSLGYPKAGVIIDRRHQTFAYLVRRRLVLGCVYGDHRFGLRPLPQPLRSFQQRVQRNRTLFRYVGDERDADLIVDSSKCYLRALELYRSAPDVTRLIILTRDGRGTLSSSLKRQRSRRQGVSSWRRYYRRALPLFAAHVAAHHRLVVRYEELVTRPERELSRICRFLGVSYQPAMLDHGARTHHMCNGSRVRLSTTSEITPDLSWRARLSAADLRYFERRAGSLNRELGYPAAARAVPQS